tara:strand:+ start:1877 stop:3226 length:1350 start_codon:yes stop_codon:yes gene_type:complete
MKKLIIYLFTFFYLSTNAADIFVYPGATSPDFSSIAVAVDSASDGDRILVTNGSYFGDININSKSISIMPVVSSNKFTIQGDIIFNTDSLTSVKRITISTAEIIGGIKHYGANYVPKTPYVFELINCIIIGKMDLNVDNIITNLYYSTFYKSVYLNASNDVIGNSFESTDSPDTILVNNGLWSNGASLESSEIKVFANRFNNYQLRFDLNTGCIFSNIHIANNHFVNLTSLGGFSVLFVEGETTSCLIENNTFYDTSPNCYYENCGEIFHSQNGLTILKIRNNIFLTNYLFNSSYLNYYKLFSFYPDARSTVLKVENNFFNSNFSFDDGMLINNDYYGFFKHTPRSAISANNIFQNTQINSLEVNDTSGVPLTTLLSYTENAGKNIMECRDIDDTQNDLGPWGGPYSWENFHKASFGKARIINIDINSSINSITNGSLNIKAKSINTNK